MQRREFITLLAGATAAWPLAARAQQREHMRSVGVLTPFAAHDTEGQNRVTAFAQALQQLGWSVGQNVRLLYRWGDGTSATTQKYAAELVALAPDVILADSSAAVAPLLQATRTIPIVFAIVADPVGAGYVKSCWSIAASNRPVARNSAAAAASASLTRSARTRLCVARP